MHCGSAIIYPSGVIRPADAPGPLPVRWRRWLKSLRETADELVCHNSGAPMMRKLSEHIMSSLLGNGRATIRLPERGRYGIAEDPASPALERAWQILAQAGFASPEEAADSFTDLPEGRLHVKIVPVPKPGSGRGRGQSDRNLLRNAVILGRCTSTLYDSSRPVIWTSNRLDRWVHLYQPGGFYDED
ncbi:MAG: hypothetical protein ACI9TH_003652 [Kiritimatiellia bacterium]|jgi:hypothetical protein